jgi:hypothetical protein
MPVDVGSPFGSPESLAPLTSSDFFHVDYALTFQPLYCLFVIEVGSRYVHILGVTANRDGPWTAQRIRNFLMDLGDRAADFRSWSAGPSRQFTRVIYGSPAGPWVTGMRAGAGMRC